MHPRIRLFHVKIWLTALNNRKEKELDDDDDIEYFYCSSPEDSFTPEKFYDSNKYIEEGFNASKYIECDFVYDKRVNVSISFCR